VKPTKEKKWERISRQYFDQFRAYRVSNGGQDGHVFNQGHVWGGERRIRSRVPARWEFILKYTLLRSKRKAPIEEGNDSLVD
jgi:hypothetical protein